MTATHATRGAPNNGETARRRSRGRPRLEDVAEIENDLVEVALVEFLKHGYGGTSMAMIVKAAGISKTTLYSRFSSKEELFIAMMNKMVEGNLSAQIRAATSPPLPLEDMLRQFAYRSLEIGLDPIHYGVTRLIFGESNRFPELRLAGEKLFRASTTGIVNVLNGYAEREGIVFKDPIVPARALTFALRGVHVDILLKNSKELDAELRSRIDEIVKLLMASIDQW